MRRLAAAACLGAALVVLPASAAAQDAQDEAKHPTLGLGDRLQLEFLARVQLDLRRGEDDDERDLDIGRRRVGIRGRFTRALAWEADAEVEADRPWRDAYLEYRQSRAVRIRAGRFKLPFSLDHTTSSANLDFIDRSLAATRLAPGRDQGVMGHGRVWSDRLKYEIGAFGGGTSAARITVRPFGTGTSPLGPLAGAVAVTRGAAGERLVEGVWVNGARRRTGVELRWQPGPLTLTTEYLRMTAERRGQGIAGDDLVPLVMRGWYVSGTWRLRPTVGGRRARVDLAGRLDGLMLGEADAGLDSSFSPRTPIVPARRERAVTLGLTWYATGHVKVQFNAVRERAGQLPAGQGGAWMPMARLQISL